MSKIDTKWTFSVYAIASVLFYWSLFYLPALNAQPQNQIETVNVAKPIQKNITLWDEYTGRFSATDKVEVKARVSGYLESINFAEGQHVKKDDLLFIIDPRPFVAEVALREGELAKANAEIEFKSKEYDRFTALSKKDYAAISERDKAKFELEQAKANKTIAQANLDQAKLELEYSHIRSPINGIAGEHKVTIGNLVSGGNFQQTMLTTIIADDPIDFSFEVDENHFLHYQRTLFKPSQQTNTVQQPEIDIKLADEDTFQHRATFNFINNEFDEASGTMMIQVSLTNPEGLFVPGQFARVRIATARDLPSILLPERVILQEQTRRYVYVVDKGVVRRQYIEIGELTDNLRVIKSGLSKDDEVIVDNILKQYPGKQVNSKQVTLNQIKQG